ncbi:Uncharacterised protein [uncultured archaeon]|nr:Uncharacterised protein [uncultured archaeon]
MFLVLAMAAVALVAPVMGQGALVGSGGVDILGQGIFETMGSAFKFPAASNTNYDSVDVGNDKALAIGTGNNFPFGFRNGPAIAQNNLKIKKNQDTGNSEVCNSCSPKYNVEQIKVGNRGALAFGFATAVNNVEIVANQQ